MSGCRQVNDHILAGMMSLYHVDNANGTEAVAAPPLPTEGAPAICMALAAWKHEQPCFTVTCLSGCGVLPCTL